MKNLFLPANLPKNNNNPHLVKKTAGLLHFLDDKQSLQLHGKKCHPQQLFGVSVESPDFFRHENTLTAEHGYCFTENAKK